MNQELILVDENDVVIGYGGKLQVHENAQLHRAFSIFVLNNNSELLLQKQAYNKYHSGGLWANTCCSHPVRGEDQEVTARRRLVEEMGIQCSLQKILFSCTKQNWIMVSQNLSTTMFTWESLKEIPFPMPTKYVTGNG
jgi:isopentenyl-diphosphate delta-isomerase type 1